MNASKALKQASTVLVESPVALQLRYLQTLATMATEKNSTIVFPLPINMVPGLYKNNGEKKIGSNWIHVFTASEGMKECHQENMFFPPAFATSMTQHSEQNWVNRSYIHGNTPYSCPTWSGHSETLLYFFLIKRCFKQLQKFRVKVEKLLW